MSHSIEELIEFWHEGDDTMDLHEYLGWTHEEYKHYLETGEEPDE